MKRVLLCTMAAVVAASGSLAFADIQAPPGARHGVFRKLSRGLTNIFYGPAEIPYSWNKTRTRDGNVAAAGYGIINGAERTLVRIGYGLYEVVTFPFPTHKKGYAPAIPSQFKRGDQGYSEFPPNLGFSSETDFVIPGNREVFY